MQVGFILIVLIQMSININGQTSRPPHIIFILASDLGWNDVSYNGMNEIYTPNIDTLASAGTVLNNYYTVSASTPSRAAILTGLYPIRTGMQHGDLENSIPGGLTANATTLAERLKSLGYTTRMVGKWNLGFSLRKYTPTTRGFDSHFGSWTGSLDYYQYNSEDYLNLPSRLGNLSKYVSGKDLWNNFVPQRRISGEYATDLFTDAAIDVIKSHNDNTPLFLYLSHVGVSRGNQYPSYRTPAYAERFGYIRDPVRRAFAGSLYALDQSVCGVMEALYKKNMLDNSIVVFTSDTGAPITGPNRNGGSNYPLRSQRNTNWEGSIRVPAIIWKADIPEGVYDSLMHATDWLPTLFAAAGGNPDELGQIDGLNQWPAISSDLASPRKRVLINIDPIYNTFAFRSGDIKMISGNYSYVGNTKNPWDQSSGRLPNPRPRPARPSRVLQLFRLLYRDPKYNPTLPLPPVNCGNVPRTANPNECNQVPCLFDIAADPCETDNIVDREAELLFDLLAEMYDEISAVNTSAPLLSQKQDSRANPVNHCGFWDNWEDSQQSATFCRTG